MRALTADIEAIDEVEVFGRVKTVQGLLIEVVGPVRELRVGGRVRIDTTGGGTLQAEIIGFRDGHALCLPYGPLTGVRLGCKAVFQSHDGAVYPGEAWLGRVVNANGEPIDGKGPIARGIAGYPLKQQPLPAHERARVGAPMDLGVRVMNTFTTMCEGQRMGIFAGSGVGKSTTMSMIARASDADITVLALVGERGRELRDFLERDLGEEGLKRSVVTVATSDTPALARMKAAYTGTAIAEYFRDQGHDVMLMMDSVTRFAMAQREVGLAIGEPPATKGYTPSCFALLPKLMERAGTSPNGSITAMYTVLVDGDDMNEPIADTVRGILDGHIVLNRKIAHKNRYPAVDVLQSVSRVFTEICTKQHQEAAKKLRAVLATYAENEDLINIGAYQKGASPKVDYAIKMIDEVEAFLKQDVHEGSNLPETVERMIRMMS